MTAPAMTAPAAPGAPDSATSAPASSVAKPTRATFKNVTAGTDPITVHFNPVSLQLVLSNTLDDKSSDKNKAQYVSKSSSKLTMDLIFDTTDTGSDVRQATGAVAAFMEAQGKDATHRTPPTVLFEWGTFTFQGICESYRETLDFFSYDGVPLRASVNLTLTQQSVVFSDSSAPSKSTAVDVPPSAGNASQVASSGGNPGAGRGLAAANGLESMRFSAGPLTVDASVKLSGPVAFASGGAGAGIGIGGGLGIGGGIGIGGGVGIGIGGGIGGGIGIGASAGIGVSGGIGASAGASFGGGAVAMAGPAFGGSAAAGVSATAGAFAGLRMSTQAAGPALDPSRLLPRPAARVVAVGPQASFGIGGQARVTGSASLGTDVGGGVSAQASIRFDGG